MTRRIAWVWSIFFALVVGSVSAQATATKEAPPKEAPAKRTPDVVYVPTPYDVAERMLELAKVTKTDVVYDLGCGDGRIVVTAAKKYGCQGVGFDINAVRVKESLDNVAKAKVDKLVSIKEADIFEQDLSKASVVTLYLLPTLNVRLIPQLEKLKPGSRIVSHDFDMRGVKPDEVITVNSSEDGHEHKIYLWTVPLKKEAEAK
jgi:SAM-dependent methyltransferase